MPSRPAISIAAKARYGLASGSGKRTSTRLAFGLVGVGNAARGRAVARRIGEQHRRLEARHQALVGVGGRVGEGVDRLGVLDDAGDVGQAGLRQVGIFVAGEHRLAVLPDRLVAVHARAVVAVDRLRHEGRGLAVDLGDLLDAVFVDLHAGRPSRVSGENFRPSSCWADATSWWCFSTLQPMCAMAPSISERMSCAESCGGTGK